MLEGSLQKSGNQLRLTIQMIRARDGTLIWAEVFHANIEDIFKVQDEVAEKVFDSIARHVPDRSRAAGKNRYSENVEAYKEYLKGRFYYQTKRDPQSLIKALGHFEKCIELEPIYPLAYAGIADVYLMLPLLDEMLPRLSLPRAKAAILRALEMDPDLAEAHTSLGICLVNYDWNWQGAEVSFRNALAIDPNYAAGRQIYATFLLRLGRVTDAIVELQEARRLDPLSPAVTTWLAEAMAYMGEYDAAIVLLRDTIKFSPEYSPAYYHLTSAQLLAGRPDDAAETSRSALLYTNNISLSQFAAVFLKSVLGEKDAAIQILHDLLKERDEKYVSAVNIASCYATFQDAGQTLYWLEVGLEDHDPNLTWIKVDKEFAFLRNNPVLPKYSAVSICPVEPVPEASMPAAAPRPLR